MRNNKLFLIFLKVFGLYPKRGKFSYFYTCFLLFLLIIIIIRLDVLITVKVFSISNITEYAAGLFVRFICFVILVSSLFNCDIQNSISYELQIMDLQLKLGFGINAQHSSIKNGVYLKIMAYWIIFLGLMLSLSKFWTLGALDFIIKIVIIRMVNNTRFLQLIVCMEELKARLKCISNILNELDSNDRQLKLKLYRIKNLYDGLYNILNLINQCFAVDLVCMFTQSVIALIINTFWIFLALSTAGSPKFQKDTNSVLNAISKVINTLSRNKSLIDTFIGSFQNIASYLFVLLWLAKSCHSVNILVRF